VIVRDSMVRSPARSPRASRSTSGDDEDEAVRSAGVTTSPYRLEAARRQTAPHPAATNIAETWSIAQRPYTDLRHRGRRRKANSETSGRSSCQLRSKAQA